MKTKIFMLLSFATIILFLVSCETKNKVDGSAIKHSELSIVEYDSCEYVFYDYGFGDLATAGLAHKGNCKYCALRNNK